LDGHQVTFVSGDARLPQALQELKPDICFNIVEGMYGDAREAQIPALLELLRIPYTASRVLTSAIALDKTMTKRIWQSFGLPTATFQLFVTGDESLQSDLRFPLFVKPAREGSGMGMDAGSIVYDEPALRSRVQYIIQRYQQPALVETYLSGREFTVGVLGRADARQYSRIPDRYAADGFMRLPVSEVDSADSVTPGVYGAQLKVMDLFVPGQANYRCPAPIDATLTAQLQQLAIDAHCAIGACDVSRVDIRLAADGTPTLIEINTLPGMAPDFSDLALIINAAQLTHADLVREILYLGASRYGMLG
jgi:D-alanine-D-alanine ligase